MQLGSCSKKFAGVLCAFALCTSSTGAIAAAAPSQSTVSPFVALSALGSGVSAAALCGSSTVAGAAAVAQGAAQGCVLPAVDAGAASGRGRDAPRRRSWSSRLHRLAAMPSRRCCWPWPGSRPRSRFIIWCSGATIISTSSSRRSRRAPARFSISQGQDNKGRRICGPFFWSNTPSGPHGTSANLAHCRRAGLALNSPIRFG